MPKFVPSRAIIGVAPVTNYEIKRIDSDFFAED
jgi:hypothetical protein